MANCAGREDDMGHVGNGTKRTLQCAEPMSALRGKADIAWPPAHVAF